VIAANFKISFFDVAHSGAFQQVVNIDNCWPRPRRFVTGEVVSNGARLTLCVSFFKMNLSLYSVNAFLILDAEGHRVLAKYYRPKGHPQGESKDLLSLKDQRAFEKGLWQKTKKPGGV
jgi:hypothetical protein